MTEVLIKAEHVSKKFCRDFKRSLWYGMKDIGRSLLGQDHSQDELRKDEFWAVKDISFEVRRGECLGLIGHNGAGKSTLLKMLNGLINPDQGKITMRGRIGALIELGAGFNPLLTGRENIYNNGAVLGFTKKEIDEKYNAIVEFSEIGEFIDAPVQNYSSGMKVRLGFAVAAQLEPDILLIDEILAVGDMSFRLKCIQTIGNILEKTAVIFVSHAMPQVSRISNKLLLMEHGAKIFEGYDVSNGIDIYYKKLPKPQTEIQISDKGKLITLDIKSLDLDDDMPNIQRLDDLFINIYTKVTKQITRPYFNIIIFDNEQKPVGTTSMDNYLTQDFIIKEEDGFNFYKFDVKIPRINLSKGVYSVTFVLKESKSSKPILRAQNIIQFQVKSKDDNYPPIEFESFNYAT